MTEPFVGEIQLFGFNFAPRNWALCNGATLSIQQYSTLFALLGTNYGGNGTTNFQLPNLTARAPGGQGRGPGLTPRTIGEVTGEQSVTLTLNEMPNHTHMEHVFNGGTGPQGMPTPGAGITPPRNINVLAPGAPNTSFAPIAVQSSGGNQPHENQQPFLALNFSIALAGVFPSFS